MLAQTLDSYVDRDSSCLKPGMTGYARHLHRPLHPRPIHHHPNPALRCGFSNGRAFFQQVVEQQLEGIVAKTPQIKKGSFFGTTEKRSG